MHKVALLALIAGARADDEVNCAALRTKELRKFLDARGLKCEGCAEKSDFVQMCEENQDAPLVEKPKPAAEPKDDKNIDDILASMKGMPGMDGIKMCANLFGSPLSGIAAPTATATASRTGSQFVARLLLSIAGSRPMISRT